MRLTLGVLGVAAIGLSACGTGPTEDIVVTGTVTFGGTPVAGGSVAIVFADGPGYAYADIEAGGIYRVAAEVMDLSVCPTAGIVVSALDAGASVLGEDRRDIGACGEHVVDFAF